LDKHVFPAIEFIDTVFYKGKGSYLFTKSGKRILDLNSGQFCTIFGHGNHLFNLRVYLRSRGLINTNTASITNQFLYASKLLFEIAEPFEPKVLLMSTGAEAVEASIRYAKSVKNKSGLVSIERGYHGLSLGAQSVTFGGSYAYPRVNDTYSVPLPLNIESEEVSLKVLEEILDTNEIAALIMEPIIAVGGMIYLSNTYIERAIRICRKKSVYVIFDESQTGFGRTGTMFSHQRLCELPDMIVMAKAIGSGFPVSAVLFNSRTFDFDTLKISNYNSHQNDPFSSSVIIESIMLIRKKNLLKRVVDTGSYFLSQLVSLQNRTNKISNSRGLGLMLAVDLNFGEVDYRELSKILGNSLIDRGFMVQFTSQGRVIRLLPDYFITKKSIDNFIIGLEEVLITVSNEH